MREVGHTITETCTAEEVQEVNEDIQKIEERWKELNLVAKKRKETIEENYELSSQFFDSAAKLVTSFDDITVRIKSDQSIGKDKSMVRAQIRKHKVGNRL